MSPTSISIKILVLVIFTLPTLNISLSTNGSSSNVGCIESEKQALLVFKHHLLDPANRLASWVAHEDCCRRWVGVVCHSVSGHVLQLHLQNPFNIWDDDYERSRLGGKIHHSLLNLNLTHLSYLDLSNNEFGGPIPDGLQNLTSLRHLDLSSNQFNSSIPDWFYGFGPLEFLNLQYSDLRGKISSAIGNLTSAISLDLSWNRELEGGIPKSLGNNLCDLKSISLSGVKLSQNISDILQMLSLGCISHGLESLHLRYSQLFGQITGHLGYLKNLRELYLSYNSIVGSIPVSLGELSMLRVLDVSDNKLEGNLPESFGQLANLEDVRFENNLLKGVICETHFANLTKLENFDGSGNSFILKVHPNWIPPFQLDVFEIGSWHLGPQIPSWLHSQKQLVFLDISNSGISGSIPSWFWNMSSQFSYLNISHNQIYGEIPSLQSDASFDFSSNCFNGSLPQISSNLRELYLSNNSLSGSLSSFLCHRMNETMSLEYLILSENFLSGELPDCWVKWPNLQVIKLDGNNLNGSIPPHSLQNCTNLVILDLSENELSGQIPTWLGAKSQKLEMLNLRSNKFHGQIPKELCALASLRILDLSRNNLSGFLPKCISNLSAMATPGDEDRVYYYLATSDDNTVLAYYDYGSLVMKGNLLNYSTTLRLVRIIDLSNNKLSGEIPEGVVKLQCLQSLNLSHNHLSGRIPRGIGAMKSLESLDFSENNLSGPIPQSISNLTFLSRLNLSNNDLIGKIPSSTQISGFPASSFIGNQLCGPPLTQNCSAPTGEINPSMRNEDKGDEVDWFYVAMAIGFGTGFGAVLVLLMVSRRWSCIYFQFLDQMWTRILLFYAKATRFHAV